MALGQDNPRDMPRLLEPGWVPAPSQARRFWEYLHRWRVSLFHHCIREACGDTQPADLARLVDHLLGTRLLLCYVGRWTKASTPDLPSLCAASQSTSSGFWAGIQASFSCPILRSVFHPAWIPAASSVPATMLCVGLGEADSRRTLAAVPRSPPAASVLWGLSSALCRQPSRYRCLPPLRKRHPLHAGPDCRLPRQRHPGPSICGALD